MIVKIVGSIGVGKSTLIENMRKRDYVCVDEGFKQNVFLERFYHWKSLSQEERNTKPSFGFQTQATFIKTSFDSYIENLVKNAGEDILFFDRCIDEVIVFTKNMLNEKSLEQAEYDLLVFFIDQALKSISELEKNHKIVYVHLKCKPETSLARIKQRGRQMEAELTLNYLNGLRVQYDDVLMKRLQGQIVHQIDTDCAIRDVEEQLMLILNL